MAKSTNKKQFTYGKKGLSKAPGKVKTVKGFIKKAPAHKVSGGVADDIIDLIHDDHRALKPLIKVMKELDKYSFDVREEAFKEFARLFTLHSKPEERTMYEHLKHDKEYREMAFEREVEHALTERLMEDIRHTKGQEDLWDARVKILAQLVEDHLEEEEEELLADFRKGSSKEKRAELARQFLKIKEAMGEGGENVEEDTLTEQMLATMRQTSP